MAFLAGLTFEVFIFIVIAFFVLESVFLYAEAYLFNYLLLIPFGVLVYHFFGSHDINLWYLSTYPLLSAVWLAIYWYLTMHRTALEISNGVSREGSIKKFHDTLNYSHELRRHFKEDWQGTNKVTVVDIQHPPASELCINGLFFLPSIIVFFCDNFFRYVYNSLLAFMESVRKSFSEAINEKFAFKVPEKVDVDTE